MQMTGAEPVPPLGRTFHGSSPARLPQLQPLLKQATAARQEEACVSATVRERAREPCAPWSGVASYPSDRSSLPQLLVPQGDSTCP